MDQTRPELDFRAIFEAAPRPYLVLSPDTNFTILAVSGAYLSATLKSRDSILGRGMFEAFPDNPAEPNATGVANLRASLTRVVANKVADRMPVQKYDIRSGDTGTFEERFWSPINTPVFTPAGTLDYILHQFDDVTEFVRLEREGVERERVEQALRESREWFSTTLNSIADAVIATDPLGRILFSNPEAEALTGWRQADAIGRDFGEVVRLEEFETGEAIAHHELAARCESPPVLSTSQTVLRARNGVALHVDATTSPIRNVVGECVGSVVIVRDVTEQSRSERDRNGALEALRENNRRKDEFLAMLSHELRNPLASIRMALETFDLTDEADEREWAKGVLDRQVGQLSRLLEDLLDVSRITRGMIRLRKQKIDLRPVIDQAVESVRPLIDDRRHSLEVDIAADTPRFEADPFRLEQVLVNLLNNAARYTPNGGRISLRASQVGEQVVIRVRDNGVGISQDALPEMFELFSQGSRTLGRSEGGLGVGLTIVKNLVEQHGGRVSASSDGPNLGSMFMVRFPIGAGVEPAADEPPAAPDRQTVSRVLIVDDNRDLARGLARLLKLLGYQVETVFDGPEGVTAARDYRPDVILLDIGLPTMDGYEVARTLRGDKELPHFRIIAISGYGHEDDRRRSREAGMDYHLTKPVDMKMISELIAAPLR